MKDIQVLFGITPAANGYHCFAEGQGGKYNMTFSAIGATPIDAFIEVCAKIQRSAITA